LRYSRGSFEEGTWGNYGGGKKGGEILGKGNQSRPRIKGRQRSKKARKK